MRVETGGATNRGEYPLNAVLFAAILGLIVAPFSVSAYVDSEGIPPWGITASGVETKPGICACGPGYSFGARFYSTETGWIECQDRGGLVSNRHLDIWMKSEERMVEWGRKMLLMVVLER